MKHAYFIFIKQCGKGLIVFNELNVPHTRIHAVFDKDLLCFFIVAKKLEASGLYHQKLPNQFYLVFIF